MVEMSFFGKDREVQSGRWEWLLCTNCEQRFSRWENYFAREWAIADRLPPYATPKTEIQISKLDYAQFKSFHLSILWRLGASKLKEHSAVKLASHHDRIATMLLNDDPGQPDCYPFWAHLLVHQDGRIATDIAVDPHATRVDGVPTYVSMFSGCAWYYYLTDKAPSKLFPEQFRFTVKGTLLLGAVDAYSYPSIKRIIDGYFTNARDA